jgi:hypothetical protein
MQAGAIVVLACAIGSMLVPTSGRAADWQLGKCAVAQNAPAPCVPVRGKAATGVEPVAGHTVHEACTAAKQNARTNLLMGIPAACGANIGCNDPCRTIQK